MKVYLLNSPFLPGFVRTGRWQGTVARGGELYYPFWLAYAAGVLEQEFEVRLVDAIAWKWDMEKVLEDAARFAPDIVVVDSNFSSLSNDIRCAKAVKGVLPGVKTVLVGPPASQFVDRILEETAVDFVAPYEYDFTLRDLARAIASGKGWEEIAGICYRENGLTRTNRRRELLTSEELDRLPFVSSVYKKHLRVKDYFLSQALYPMVQILTGRGCPNFCTFCSWPMTLSGREYRARSVASVVEEIEYIKKELPEVKEIFIEDDTFTIDRNRVAGFCSQLKQRGLHITWSCNARANLDFETMKLMKAAGCRLLDVGFESGSEQILKNIKKGVSRERMMQFAADARRAGLMVLGDFVFGFPGETRETAEETIRFARQLRPNVVQFAVAVPLPGTEFHRWAKENGYLQTELVEQSIDECGFQKCIVSTPEFSSREVEAYVDKALKRYYLSPSYVPVALGNVLRKHGWHELKGMWKSGRVFLRYLFRKKAA